MKIIDFRFRPNTPEAIKGMLSNKVFGDMFRLCEYEKRANPQPLEDIVADLKAFDVARCVVTGRDAETTYGLPSGDQGVLDLMRAYPDMFIGYAGYDPHKGMEALRVFESRIVRDGMKGACTDPYLARIPADHAKFYPLYAKCCELDVPVVITTGTATLVKGAVIEDAHPRRIDRVAADFPELRIVISHGCYPWVNEVIVVVYRHRNVYLEISEYEQSPFAEGYYQAANDMIGDKMLFASAAPFLDIREQAELYKTLPFAPGVLEKIMYGNAARLLGLAQNP